jgi:hypothetical protein
LEDSEGVTNTGSAYLADSSGTLPTGLSFSDNPSESFTIAPSTITAITNTGTNMVLQASNDITVDQEIITDNPAGDGGALTLQAGRNLIINANITTDNGNLTLIAKRDSR